MQKILLGLLACAGVVGAADVSGKWASATLYLILKQDGSQLSGSAGPSEKEQILTLSNGAVEGDRVTFQMGSFQIGLQVNGDEMKGEMKNAAGSTPVFLKRVTDRPAAGRRTFEVASVKRSPPPTGNGINSSMRLDPGRLTCSNVSLKKLIYESYGVKDYQVSGPDWLGTEIYDITATVPPGVTRDDVQVMIQSLLADRFRLIPAPRYAGNAGSMPWWWERPAPNFRKWNSRAAALPPRMGSSPPSRSPFATSRNSYHGKPAGRCLDMTGLKGFYSVSR